LEYLYKRDYANLGSVNNSFFNFISEELGIKVPVILLSNLEVDGYKSDLVLKVCKKLGVDVYVSGNGGKAYLNEQNFSDSHIKIDYIDSQNAVYKQFNGEFIPDLSMLDMMFNVDKYFIQQYLGVK
jgi:hypothetical protein